VSCRFSAGFRCVHAGLSISAMVVAVAVLAACSPQVEQPSAAAGGPDETADLEAIGALVEQVNQADMSGDVEGLLAHHTDDVVSMPPGLPAMVGKESLRAYYLEAFAQLSIERLEMTPEETRLAGDWAFSWGRFEETVVPVGGNAFDVVGKYLFIFHREADGSWKIARMIGNLDGPQPGL